ncbi:MAG: energy transducer TonB [Gammaproteobacteria bacterium]|nr:energy transducer TonB [Gammaproteobacteria bacterium]
MANIAKNLDPLDELRLVARPAPDRLPAMLFLAALIHGVLIIGIAFNPALIDEFAEAISLEVTIVADADQHIDRPDRAEYLAQASQEGGGNTTEQVRPSSVQDSAAPIDNLGTENGNSFTDSTTHERAADELLSSQRQQDFEVQDDPRSEPQPDERIALALEKGSDTSLPLPQEERATLLIHDDDPRQLVISADTEESNVALYLDNWKRRIEAVGDDYFPELGSLDGLTGSPTLEVSINSSGELAEVIIRKSSGSAVLDQAALDILRRASPFDPFPVEIRGDYDSLRFAYKWLFVEDVVTKTASVN